MSKFLSLSEFGGKWNHILRLKSLSGRVENLRSVHNRSLSATYFFFQTLKERIVTTLFLLTCIIGQILHILGLLASLPCAVDTTANVEPQKVALIPPFLWYWRLKHNMESMPLYWGRWIRRLWYNIYCREEASTLLWSRCVNSSQCHRNSLTFGLIIPSCSVCFKDKINILVKSH